MASPDIGSRCSAGGQKTSPDTQRTGPGREQIDRPADVGAARLQKGKAYRHGALPVLAYVKETYDATVGLALAAQAGGGVDGAAIRDRLRAIGSRPGTAVTAGPQGVAAALRILAQGGEIDYEGAAGSTDWDENGDLRRGHIGIWRFTENERIEEVGTVAFPR